MSTKIDTTIYSKTIEANEQSLDSLMSTSTVSRRAKATAAPVAPSVALGANSTPQIVVHAAATSWGERIMLSGKELVRWLQNALAEWRHRLAHSALVVRAMSAFRNSTPRQRAIVGLALLFLIVGGYLLLRGRTTSNDTEQSVVTQWLDAQVAGGTGKQFVASYTDAAHLHFHSLRSWRILAQPKPGEFLLDLNSKLPDGTFTTTECRVTVDRVEEPDGSTTYKITKLVLYPTGESAK